MYLKRKNKTIIIIKKKTKKKIEKRYEQQKELREKTVVAFEYNLEAIDNLDENTM